MKSKNAYDDFHLDNYNSGSMNDQASGSNIRLNKPNDNTKSVKPNEKDDIPISNKKRYKKTMVLKKSNETFRDVGGMESSLKELCEILMHFKAPDAYFALGLLPPRGVLLHGPSGCGKTLLANAIAGVSNH